MDGRSRLTSWRILPMALALSQTMINAEPAAIEEIP